MNNPIYVSILIPVYGVEKYIERCARSAFEQSYPYLEYIFVNDATRDQSMEILRRVIEEYPMRKDQVRIIEHLKNRGLAGARETAVQNATGDYLFHLDSDDYLEPESIYTLVALIDPNAPCDLVAGAHRSIYSGRSNVLAYTEKTPEELLPKMLMRTTFYHIWNLLIRRSLYEGLEIPPINNGEDYITVCRLMVRARSLSTTTSVTYNYTHENENAFQHQMTCRKNIDELEQSSLYLREYFFKEESLRTYLCIGQLMAYAMILYNCTPSQMRDIIIPDSLKAYLKDSRVGKMRLLLQLHQLHLYLPIRFISYLHKRFLAQ